MWVLRIGFWFVLTILAANQASRKFLPGVAWAPFATIFASAIVGCIVCIADVSESPKKPRRNESIQVSTRRKWLMVPVSWWPLLGLLSVIPVFICVSLAWTRTMNQIGYYVNSSIDTAISSPSVLSLTFDTIEKQSNRPVKVTAVLKCTQTWPLALVCPWDTLSISASDLATSQPVPNGTVIEDVSPYFLGKTPTHLPARMKPIGEQVIVGNHLIMRWGAFWFDVAMVAAMAWILAILGSIVRMFRTTPSERRELRIVAGMCPECRYTGGHVGTCPECGNTA